MKNFKFMKYIVGRNLNSPCNMLFLEEFDLLAVCYFWSKVDLPAARLRNNQNAVGNYCSDNLAWFLAFFREFHSTDMKLIRSWCWAQGEPLQWAVLHCNTRLPCFAPSPEWNICILSQLKAKHILFCFKAIQSFEYVCCNVRTDSQLFKFL